MTKKNQKKNQKKITNNSPNGQESKVSLPEMIRSTQEKLATMPLTASNIKQVENEVKNITSHYKKNRKSTSASMTQENTVSIKTTKRNYLFTVQKRVGQEWERITDAVFTKRSNARECVRELRNVSQGNYRVRKMIIAS